MAYLHQPGSRSLARPAPGSSSPQTRTGQGVGVGAVVWGFQGSLTPSRFRTRTAEVTGTINTGSPFRGRGISGDILHHLQFRGPFSRPPQSQLLGQSGTGGSCHLPQPQPGSRADPATGGKTPTGSQKPHGVQNTAGRPGQLPCSAQEANGSGRTGEAGKERPGGTVAASSSRCPRASS